MNGCRARTFCEQLVRKYHIDLHPDLVVLTEVASGSYLYNPMIALIARAKKVLVFCRDSRYGKKEDVISDMREEYRRAGLDQELVVCNDLTEEVISEADIITNSGHLRPFDDKFIRQMKATAVLPLMWEPWEIREGEIDLESTRKHEVLVLGTNEHKPPCDMAIYCPLTALNLMMQHQAAICDDNILIIGGQNTLADAIYKSFSCLGLNCRQIKTSAPVEEIDASIHWATYIIVAEHEDKRMLIGPCGLIDPNALTATGIYGVGVIAGQVDRDTIEANGISVYPDIIAPPGYMSYLPSELGPYAVMDLFAGGLKVGEAMARARLQGLSPRKAAIYAMQKSPAMDLEENIALV
jgi:hypothetical protein